MFANGLPFKTKNGRPLEGVEERRLCATKQTKLLLQRSCWGTFYLAVGVTFISAREINHKMSLECVYGCSHPLWGGAGECIEGDSCRCDVGYASRDLFGNPSCVPQKV